MWIKPNLTSCLKDVPSACTPLPQQCCLWWQHLWNFWWVRDMWCYIVLDFFNGCKMMSSEPVLRRAGSATEQDLERTVVGWWVEFDTSIEADALWGRCDKMQCHCTGSSWVSILAAFSIECHLSDICKLRYKKWNVSFVQSGKVWVHLAQIKNEWMNEWINK
jgi:hypothetical protein